MDGSKWQLPIRNPIQAHSDRPHGLISKLNKLAQWYGTISGCSKITSEDVQCQINNVQDYRPKNMDMDYRKQYCYGFTKVMDRPTARAA